MSRVKSITKHRNWKFSEIQDPQKEAKRIKSYGRGFRIIKARQSFGWLVVESILSVIGYCVLLFFMFFFINAALDIAVGVLSAYLQDLRWARMIITFLSITVVLVIIFQNLYLTFEKYADYFRNRKWDLILESAQPLRRGTMCRVDIKRQHHNERQDHREKKVWSRLVCNEVTKSTSGTSTTYHSQQIWVHEFEPYISLGGDILARHQLHLPHQVPVHHYGQKVCVIWEWQVIVEIGGRVEDKASFMVEVL